MRLVTGATVAKTSSEVVGEERSVTRADIVFVWLEALLVLVASLDGEVLLFRPLRRSPLLLPALARLFPDFETKVSLGSSPLDAADFRRKMRDRKPGIVFVPRLFIFLMRCAQVDLPPVQSKFYTKQQTISTPKTNPCVDFGTEIPLSSLPNVGFTGIQID